MASVVNYQPASQPQLTPDQLSCIAPHTAYQEFSDYKQVIQPVTYRSLEHVSTTYKPLPQVVTIKEDLQPPQDVWTGCTPEQVAAGTCHQTGLLTTNQWQAQPQHHHHPHKHAAQYAQQASYLHGTYANVF